MPEVPQGRAGRQWLIDRLAIAERGDELLHQKQQLLRRERQRLNRLRDAAQREWLEAQRDATRWSARANALGGPSEIALGALGVEGRARISVTWLNTMGVNHPDRAEISAPPVAPVALVAANSAMAPALVAHRRALRAAASQAVVTTAVAALDVELAATSRRLRAIERHRLPELREQLHRLVFHLDEIEREERLVSRWAAHRHEEDS